jgi:beta-lactamase regulating signal transducer with metallopeptidase domain
MDAIHELLTGSPAGVLALDVAGKSILVLAAAGLATLGLRQAAAATRHLVWCLALCGTLLLPLLALATPGWAWPLLPARGARTVPPPLASAAAPSPGLMPQPLPVALVPESAPRARPRSAGPVAASASLPPPPPEPGGISALAPSSWLMTVWATVASAVLTLPLMGRLAVRRLQRRAQPMEDGEWVDLLHDLTAQLGVSPRVTLLRSHQALVPMTWGWLRPVVLLPAGADSWPAVRRRDVLAHELAHIHRRDFLTQTLAQLACAVYWFNPLAWTAARRLRTERERACDDIVLTAGARASEYAEHLLDLARSLRSRHRHSLAALAMARPSQLEGRLLAILDERAPRRGVTRRAVMLGLLTLATVTLPLSLVRLGVQVAAAGPAQEEHRASPRHAEPSRTVTGRVVDAQGKPVPGARVAVVAERRKQVGDIGNFQRYQLAAMAAAESDREGRFQVDFPAIPPARLAGLSAIALAPGYGLDGSSLKTDSTRQEATITLDPEKMVEGRLVDVQGLPAAGVSVRVRSLTVRSHGYHPYDPQGSASLWPAPVATDADGRFRLRGLSAPTAIELEVEDPRFAHQTLEIAAGDEGRTNAKTMSLVPAQAIDVRVVRAADGKPMAGAWVNIRAEKRNPYSWGETAGARADDQGRVRIVPWPGDGFTILAYPKEGEPYLRREASLDWPKGAVQQSVEVKLKRGVVVRGKLTEEPSGQPVAGAGISYYQTHRNNPRYDGSFNRDTVSGPDGTFNLVVPHGPGHLLVRGPSADYLHVPTSHGELGTSWMPNLPLYPDALAHLDIKPGAATHEMALRLRRGVTVPGRVIGPDGSPIAEAFAMGRTYAPYDENRFDFMPFNGGGPRLKVRDGRFEIPGCDPDKPSPFHFLDVKNQLGATVEISGRSAATGPVTVQLQKCGSARVLLKDAGGKPLANHPADEFPVNMILIITPGADFGAEDKTNADMEFQVNLDPERNRHLRTGPDGRATFVSLIPGARYRFRGHEFTAEAGKTIDLPDITVGGRK